MRKLAALALFLLLACPSVSGGHVGGVDSYGCHNNSALGRYECHKGQFAGRDFANKQEMLNLLATPPPPPAPTVEDRVKSIEERLNIIEQRLNVLSLLSWSPNTEDDIEGYRVYIGTSPRKYDRHIDVGMVIKFLVTGLTPGRTYYFAIAAFDRAGNESDYSNEVSRTI